MKKLKRNQKKKSKFCITVDVEKDWRSESVYGITEGLPRILELFKKHNVKATFFVVTSLVYDHEKKIRQILAEGHEIGIHSLLHERYSDLNPQETLLRVAQATNSLLLKGIIVKGFRAPYLITTPTYYESLKINEFKYDSSQTNFYFPTRYNYSGIPNKPFTLENGLIELPISNQKGFPGWPLSLSFLKTNWEKNKQKLELLKDQEYINMYFHPYEIINQRPEHLPLLLRKTAKVTGDEALKILEEIIVMFKDTHEFVRCEDLL